MNIFMRFAIFMLATLLAVPALAGDAGESSITLNFKDSEIREVATSIGAITGKNFIIDPRVKGRVTVISAQPINTSAAYATFLSVLQVHGFAAMPGDGNTVKIVPATDARQLPGALQVPLPYPGPGDTIVTQILELRNVPAAQLVAILRPLVPQYGQLAAYQPANIIIISDTAANVERIASIVRRIDNASDDEIEILPLQHASATDLVQTLTQLAQTAGRDGSNPVTMVADSRTNSILISGDKSERLRLTALISHLDTPLEQGGNTQVVYLSYADAENLANILKGYSTETQAAKAGGAQAGATGSQTAGVSIIPDPDTNALVITAPPKMMTSIRNVIGKLDIRRAQVLVEAIIAEITSDHAAELGVTWVADASEDHGVVGLTNFAGSGAGVVQLFGATQSGNLGAIPDGLTFGFGRIEAGVFSFAGLLRALAGDGNTNILSTPTLMTMDNEEAEIQVGQEVPFITGSFSNIGGTTGGGTTPVNPFQTIQRKEVGIKLKITPQINEGDAVILAIEQEVSSIASGATGASDLITNKRTINTHVIAESGEVIVLGGLIDDQLIHSEQRVPVLGSIPVLGNLFKYSSTKKVKRNLMVFLQPTILTDGIQAAHLTESKYNYIRNQQLQQNESGIPLMPGAERPLLPTLEEQRASGQVPPAAPAPADEPADGTTTSATESTAQPAATDSATTSDEQPVTDQ